MRENATKGSLPIPVNKSLEKRMYCRRRIFLRILSIPCATSIAGCTPDYRSIRRLAVRRVSSVSQANSTWEITVVVANMSTVDGDEGTFHEVSVLVFDEGGNRTCSEDLGDVSTEYDINNGKEVTVECPDFPHTISLQATETPCMDDTELIARVYQGRDEDYGHTWAEHSVKCGEDPPYV